MTSALEQIAAREGAQHDALREEARREERQPLRAYLNHGVDRDLALRVGRPTAEVRAARVALAERVQKMRALGVTQADIAEALDCSWKAVKRLEDTQ